MIAILYSRIFQHAHLSTWLLIIPVRGIDYTWHFGNFYIYKIEILLIKYYLRFLYFRINIMYTFIIYKNVNHIFISKYFFLWRGKPTKHTVYQIKIWTFWSLSYCCIILKKIDTNSTHYNFTLRLIKYTLYKVINNVKFNISYADISICHQVLSYVRQWAIIFNKTTEKIDGKQHC